MGYECVPMLHRVPKAPSPEYPDHISRSLSVYADDNIVHTIAEMTPK